MILSMEPLESLRYLRYLRPDGAVVTSTNPVVNIPDYPDLDGLLDRIRTLPRAAARGRREARASGRVGAGHQHGDGRRGLASPARAGRDARALHPDRCSPSKGEKVVEINLKAFRAGREAAA